MSHISLWNQFWVLSFPTSHMYKLHIGPRQYRGKQQTSQYFKISPETIHEFEDWATNSNLTDLNINQQKTTRVTFRYNSVQNQRWYMYSFISCWQYNITHNCIRSCDVTKSLIKSLKVKTAVSTLRLKTSGWSNNKRICVVLSQGDFKQDLSARCGSH